MRHHITRTVSRPLTAVATNEETRKHCLIAILILVMDLGYILNVENVMVHVVVAFSLFGQDFTELVVKALGDLERI